MANHEERKNRTGESQAGETQAEESQAEKSQAERTQSKSKIDQSTNTGSSGAGENANQAPGAVQDVSSKAPAPKSDMANQAGQAPSGGYQSPAAADHAQALHEAETRQAAIQGSASTQDRHNQGKRDSR